MNKKNVLLCVTIFILTVLASAYYCIEQPLREIVNTRYTSASKLALIFPFVWGIIFFFFAYFLGTGVKSSSLTRVIISAVFLIINIIAVIAVSVMYLSFPSYNLILTGVLFADVIFESSVKKIELIKIRLKK